MYKEEDKSIASQLHEEAEFIPVTKEQIDQCLKEALERPKSPLVEFFLKDHPVYLSFTWNWIEAILIAFGIFLLTMAFINL